MPFNASIALAGAVVGLCVGSFLNVLIHRLPRGETPWSPARSYCPACRRQIPARDNLPILSFLLLHGRCRFCGAAISWRYPLVEGATGLLFALSVGYWGLTLHAVEASLFGAVLLALGTIDAETYRLPNVLIGIGAGVGIAFGGVFAAMSGSLTPIVSRVEAGVAGFVLLLLVRWIGAVLARREAMGAGDVKLLGMIGLFLADWRLVLLTIALSALIGSVVGGVIVLRRRGGSSVVPYGPFLAFAGAVAYLFGPGLIRAYVAIFSL